MSRTIPQPRDSSPAATAEAQLELLRRRNRRVDRDYAISSLVEGIRREAARNRKTSGKFVDAWEKVIPAEFASQSRVRGISGGVAKVSVRSSAVGYELDRLLRSGALAELRAEFGGILRRVRVEQDPTPGVWNSPDQASKGG